MRHCPNCGRDVDADFPACPACGHLGDVRPCARHPDRLTRGSCVICGTAVCEECAAQGRPAHYLCERHGDVEMVEGWAQVYTTANDVEAGLIRANLEAEGVDARILSQKDHMLTVGLGELSQIRILVPAYSHQQAMRVLAEHATDRGDVSFACPQCGEAYGPEDSVCAACGATLPSELG